MKQLTAKEIRELPIGSILYYEQYGARDHKAWMDIVKVIGHKRSKPVFEVVGGILSKTGRRDVSRISALDTEFFMATTDKYYMVEMIFYRK